MEKTTNFNLNQWEPTDPIRREDFNADNAAIDAALTGKASAADLTALNQCVSALSAGAYSAANAPWETGILDLTGADSGDVAKTFGFEPSAILLGAEEISPGFGINGGTFRMDEYSSSSRYYFTLSGNELIATTVSGVPTAELHYLALK